MVIVSGLSQPLRSVGKGIASWDAAGARPVVVARSIVRQAPGPRCARRSARLHGRRLYLPPHAGSHKRFQSVDRRRPSALVAGAPVRARASPLPERGGQKTSRRSVKERLGLARLESCPVGRGGL